jgi:serine/threonine protein kinase
MVAVKCPQKNKTLGDATMMRLRSIKEWRILGKLYGHPNVVKLIGGVVMAPSEIWIITEYIEGGDLYSVTS